jgi:hypothetical protein
MKIAVLIVVAVLGLSTAVSAQNGGNHGAPAQAPANGK